MSPVSAPQPRTPARSAAFRSIAADRRTLAELIAWTTIAFVFALCLWAFRPIPLADDSYQYLSVAANFNRGEGIVTSLVHFDSERSHGRIPAPMTTFPPGYPVTLGVLSRMFGSLEPTARALACISYAGTAALLLIALILAGVTPFIRQLVLVLYVANAYTLKFATAVVSEPLYLLLSIGGIVLLISMEVAPLTLRRQIARAVAGFTLIGVSCWVRYAGLFLVAAVVAYAVVRFFLDHSSTRLVPLLAASISVVFTGVLLLRNYVIAGTWKGGNDMAVHNPLKRVAVDYIRAQWHLFFGDHPLIFGLWELFLILGVLSFIALMRAARRSSDGAAASLPGIGPVLVAGFCVAIYSAGIVYAGLRTPISFGTRMFLPIFPLYLLLVGIAIGGLLSRFGPRSALMKFTLLLAVVGYVGINARDLYAPAGVPEYRLIARDYAEPARGGEPLRNWIASNIPVNAPIAASEGQATGYLLGRPTLSLVDPTYSRVRWGCGEVSEQMQRFHARYLILYKSSMGISQDSLFASSPFLSTAASGHPSCGFSIAAENAVVRILKRP